MNQEVVSTSDREKSSIGEIQELSMTTDQKNMRKIAHSGREKPNAKHRTSKAIKIGNSKMHKDGDTDSWWFQNGFRRDSTLNETNTDQLPLKCNQKSNSDYGFRERDQANIYKNAFELKSSGRKGLGKVTKSLSSNNIESARSAWEVAMEGLNKASKLESRSARKRRALGMERNSSSGHLSLQKSISKKKTKETGIVGHVKQKTMKTTKDAKETKKLKLKSIHVKSIIEAFHTDAKRRQRKLTIDLMKKKLRKKFGMIVSKKLLKKKLAKVSDIKVKKLKQDQGVEYVKVKRV